MLNWSDIPDLDTVRTYILKRGDVRAELTILTTELSFEQARISKAKPRDKAVRIIGLDDESTTTLLDLQRQIAQLRAELDHIDAEIDFNTYHKEMFKALAYKERY